MSALRKPLSRSMVPLIAVLAIMPSGCRPESERTALAQAPGDGGGAADLERSTGLAVDAHRVWVSGHVDFYESTISPDGRFVTERDDSTGDLAVRDMASGSLHRLTDKGSWNESIDYFGNARFSPDGRRLAFSWYEDDIDDYEIHVLDFAVDAHGLPTASNHRVVYSNGMQPATSVYDWVTGDEVLIGIRRFDDTRALVILSLSNGSLRPLRSFGWGEYPERGPVASRDGRFVAYDRPADSDASERDLYLLSVDGGEDVKLVGAPGSDVPLGWTPGDEALLFHRRFAGEESVWSLPMSDGRPAGPAVELLGNVPNPTPIGFVGDTFDYGLVVDRPSIVTARLSDDNRELTPLPMRFEPPSGGRIRTFAWAPDGRHVLEQIDHPSRPGAWIRLMTAEGEVVGEWTFDLFIMFTHFAFAPDGNSAIVPANDARERPGWIRLDLKGGKDEMAVLFDQGGEFGRVPAFSPDGERLYFTRYDRRDGVPDQALVHVVERDLATGAERRLARVREHGAVTISPDGEWLAVAHPPRRGSKTIRVIEVRSGEVHTVYQSDSEMSRLPTVLGWSEDAGSLLFLDRVPTDRETDVGLFRVSRAGGDAERLATIEGFRGIASLHPDGRTLAYRSGESRGEIWAVDVTGGTVTPDREHRP